MAESNDTYLASIKGDQIAEGKTKVIYKIKDNPKHVLIVSKNSITAGDGAKKDELPGKGKFSTITTSNVFRLWTLAGLPTHYIQQESEDSFRALSCHMIPLEVIVRRVAAGSYVKRNPHITQGTRMDPLVVEFTFKDDANHDPLVTDEEIIKMNIQKGPITVDAGVIATLKEVATKAFAIVEKAWSKLDVTLVDYKVEFGVTPEGQVILGDVVDNDSWRVWPHGDPSLMKDKQIYRNLPGKLTEKDAALLSANYQWVAEQSNRFIDSILEPLSVGPLVGIIMGSQSDWDTMKNAADILTKLGVPFETRIVSAHRTPERLFAYAKTAKSRGLKVIIAGAGGAAHLPGMVASLTSLPVLGIPVQSRALSGMDSLLSIVQMPAGIPVGTLAIGAAGASNAALLAASILGASGKHPDVAVAYEKYRAKQTESVAEIPVDSPAHGTTEPAKHVPVSGSVVQDVIKQVSALTTSFPEKVLPPGSTIGIVGGGQLAKMIAIAAAYLGYKSHIYCPDKGSPAFQTCHEYTMADYLNKQSLCGFAAKCDVITYEFENVPKETIEFLQQYTPVRPDAHVLTISQNRMKEKTFVNSIGVPTTSFELVESHEQLKQATTKIGYPCILKSNTMGYDGKGQILIKEGDNLEQVWAKMLKMGGQSSILEGFVNFSCEVSVLVARTFAGKKSAFPVVENKHEHHILRETIAPAAVSDSIKKAAEDAALKIADGIGLIGLLAVEMFVTTDGKILVNELAPRPHNSGHWSIEGCSTSQFEQCVRSICGLPLGNVKILADKVVMKNLLGFEVNDWESYLNKENTHLHLYGKAEPREGRKMGHVTTLYYN